MTNTTETNKQGENEMRKGKDMIEGDQFTEYSEGDAFTYEVLGAAQSHPAINPNHLQQPVKMIKVVNYAGKETSVKHYLAANYESPKNRSFRTVNR